MTHLPSPVARSLPDLRTGLCALGLALAAGTAASAATVSQTQILVEDGQDMFFTFSGLGPSDGTGGTVTIASGQATLSSNPRRNGLDLDSLGFVAGEQIIEDEFFDLTLDGTSQGLFSCASGGGLTTITGSDTSVQGECQFSLVLALDGSTLDLLIGDGALNLGVFFSATVQHFDEGDEVIVSLSYTDAGPLAPVPLPAGLPLTSQGGGYLVRSAPHQGQDRLFKPPQVAFHARH